MTDRELDALVAEKVMGFVWRRNKTERSDYPDHKNYPKGADFLVPPGEQLGFGRKRADGFRLSGDTYHWVPRYSTRIDAAWDVVEKMNCHLVLSVDPKDIKPRYAVVYVGGRKKRDGDAQAETMPRAICLAALAALGVEVPR